MSITWPSEPIKMAIDPEKNPTTPRWKFWPKSLFWPKIGHWEKMRNMIKMISTRLFAIDLALIYPKHNPEGPWHHPDTPTHRRFYALEVTGRTMQYLSAMTKYDFYWIASIPDSIQSHPNTLQTPSRHPPDTSQTPQNLVLFGCGRSLGEKAIA